MPNTTALRPAPPYHSTRPRRCSEGHGDGTAQYRWLTNDLATTSKPWKILFFHCPLNTCGPHRFDSFNGAFDRLELQRLLLPVARRYGVQLMLSGHDHAFQRFAPMNGVHTVVTGG